MPTLDLRNSANLAVKVLLNEAWNFSFTVTNAVSLIGATVTMRIAKQYVGTAIQELSVGSGITIVNATALAFTPAPMTTGDSILDIEITATTGDIYRIKGRISATNE